MAAVSSLFTKKTGWATSHLCGDLRDLRMGRYRSHISTGGLKKSTEISQIGFLGTRVAGNSGEKRSDFTDWASRTRRTGMPGFDVQLSAEACAEMLAHIEYKNPSPFYSLLEISNILGWEGLAKRHHLLRGVSSTEMRTALTELFGRSGKILFQFEKDRSGAAKIVDEGIKYSYKIQFPTLDDGKQNLLGYLTEQTGWDLKTNAAEKLAQRIVEGYEKICEKKISVGSGSGGGSLSNGGAGVVAGAVGGVWTTVPAPCGHPATTQATRTASEHTSHHTP